MQGIVFDMQKFALNDGPGIRTVVFLKGCPLKCLWCCNPESQAMQPQLSYDETKCQNCFACVQACKNSAHLNINGKHVYMPKKCDTGNHCSSQCAYDALKMIGYAAEPEDLIAEVVKDKSYFRKSGGGITLSGGEPLAQFHFTLEFLKLAKKAGLNTCVETSGYAPIGYIEQIQPVTDHFLYDFKIADTALHIKYTGVSNEPIWENLDYLYKKHSSITLRCPIIPGINDTTKHFVAIAELSHKYKNLKGIEIMPYHNMGKDKPRQTNSGNMLSLKSVTDAAADQWVTNLQTIGCRNVKRG